MKDNPRRDDLIWPKVFLVSICLCLLFGTITIVAVFDRISHPTFTHKVDLEQFNTLKEEVSLTRKELKEIKARLDGIEGSLKVFEPFARKPID